MATKVIGVYCSYSVSTKEIPYTEKYSEFSVRDAVVFSDEEGKEEYGIIKYIDRNSVDKDAVINGSIILRKATANDTQRVEREAAESERAMDICKKYVIKHGLEMEVFAAGYSFDGSKIQFTFTADDRIDFRELVKDLAKDLKKQIHLRQIGPRDKAKLVGGYGKCGRPLCCNTHLAKMESIGMDMVRDQGLEGKGSSKLSGACGKLLCCLKYEVEAYKELRASLPSVGNKVRLKKTPSTAFKQVPVVIGLDILNQKVRVALDGHEVVMLDASEVEKITR